MRKLINTIVIILVIPILVSLLAQSPIVTGQFPQETTPPTLILLNQSSLTDFQLIIVAQALTGKVLNVALATRLQGIGVCGQGEWCLAITDQMVGTGSDLARGALLGQVVTREIVRGMLI